MAKITTKKPGQKDALSQKEPPVEAHFEDDLEPAPQPRAFVETTPVPSARHKTPEFEKPPVAEQQVVKATAPKPTPVKVTRASPPKVKSFSPAPPPPSVSFEEPKKKSGSLVVALGGVVLIVAALSKLNPTPQNINEADFLPSDPTAREMLVRDDPSKMAQAAWKNDEPGFIGRFFHKLCLGYAKSNGCSAAPQHPFMKVAEQLGIQLNFEQEEDKKVIEQTIEYKSRAFTFGK